MRWKELMVNSLPRSWTKNRKRSQQQIQQRALLKNKQLDDNANANDVTDLCVDNHNSIDVSDDLYIKKQKELGYIYDTPLNNHQHITIKSYKDLEDCGTTFLKNDLILTNNLNDPKQFKCSCYKHVTVPSSDVNECFFNNLANSQQQTTVVSTPTTVPKTNPKISADSDIEELNSCVTPKIRTRIKTNPWIRSPPLSPNSSETDSCASTNSSPTSSLSRSRSSSLTKDEITTSLCACADTASSTSDLGSEATGSTLDSESARAFKHLSLASSDGARSICSNSSDAGFGFSSSLDDISVNTQTAQAQFEYEAEFESVIETVESPHFGEMNAKGECGSCFSLQRLQSELAHESTPTRRHPNRMTYVIDGKIVNNFNSADENDEYCSPIESVVVDDGSFAEFFNSDNKMNTSIESDVIEQDFEPDSESESELDYYLDDVDVYTDEEVDIERKSADDVIDFNGVTWLEEYLETEGGFCENAADQSDQMVPEYAQTAINVSSSYSSEQNEIFEESERTPVASLEDSPVRHQIDQVVPELGRRSIGEIHESLKDKVTKLRQEKIIVEEKLKQAREEQEIRKRVTAQFQRQVTTHRKQVLLRTLSDLRRRLEGQCTRLQTSYNTVLNVQKNVIRQAKLRQSKLREAPF